MTTIAHRRMLVVTILTLCLHVPLLANTGNLVITGARIIDGTGANPIENGTLVISDGKVRSVGPASSVTYPEDAEVIDASGKTLMPGLINAHGHVGGVMGLEDGYYTTENLLRQLGLYARYGVTTVYSLGGDQAQGFRLRDIQESSDLDRARLYVAGSVISAGTPQQATDAVNTAADLGPDFIKTRVDDNLGNSDKPPVEVYQAIIDQAHMRRLPVAVHLFYLEDAKAVVEAGADLIAHSVRDLPVDQELIDIIRQHDVCYVPTLTREVSTFVYESEPDFFSDPFFLREVDSGIIDILSEPERQARMRNSASAQQYKIGLQVALDNVGRLHDGGVKIAMGTDSGPAARFQGYFEHLEMWMMVEAGLSPMEAIHAATGNAAQCMKLGDVGTLTPGNWGDFVILRENPLDDIENSRTIDSVWIAGNRVPDN